MSIDSTPIHKNKMVLLNIKIVIYWKLLAHGDVAKALNSGSLTPI